MNAAYIVTLMIKKEHWWVPVSFLPVRVGGHTLKLVGYKNSPASGALFDDNIFTNMN